MNDKLQALKNNAMQQLKDCGVSNVNEARLDQYVNSLKTMVNNRDALLVSGTDDAELQTVRRNFVEKKLGISDKDKGMAAIKKVADKMSSIRQKSRPAFYYLVAEELS